MSLLLLLFLFVWAEFASTFVMDAYQNPFIGRVRAILSTPMAWLQAKVPALARERNAAAALLGAALVVAVVLMPFLAANDFGVTFGGTFFVAAGRASGVALFAKLLCILGAVVVLMAQLALFRLLFYWRCGRGESGPLQELLDILLWPIAALRDVRREIGASLALLAVGVALCLAANHGAGMLQLPLVAGFLRVFLLAVLDVLLVMRGAILLLVLLSLVGFAAKKPEWTSAASLGLSDFTRLVFGRPMALIAGPFDLTPLVLLFVIQFVHPILVAVLTHL